MNDEIEVKAPESEVELQGYKWYIKFNIISTLLSAIVSIVLTVAIAFSVKLFGDVRLVFLYIIPMLAYVLS